MNTTSIQESIEETLKGKAQQLTERLEPRLQEGKRRLMSLEDQTRSLISKQPAACMVGALALGYLLARLARRERS